MIDHINLPVSDLSQASAFYTAVLPMLGMPVLWKAEDVVGFGADTWVFGIIKSMGEPTPAHVAFAAVSPDLVQTGYDAAIAAGAVCNGPPGPRPIYGPDYYAAFFFDPDGHNIEVVCRHG